MMSRPGSPPGASMTPRRLALHSVHPPVRTLSRPAPAPAPVALVHEPGLGTIALRSDGAAFRLHVVPAGADADQAKDERVWVPLVAVPGTPAAAGQLHRAALDVVALDLTAWAEGADLPGGEMAVTGGETETADAETLAGHLRNALQILRLAPADRPLTRAARDGLTDRLWAALALVEQVGPTDPERGSVA